MRFGPYFGHNRQFSSLCNRTSTVINNQYVDDGKSLGMHEWNRKNATLSQILGVMLGLMSVLKFLVPIFFVGVSLSFGARVWSMRSAKVASGLILFCVTALTLDLYHEGFEFIHYQTTHALIIIAIITIPLAGLFLLQVSHQSQIERGILLGLYGAIFLLSLDQYYFGQCRASGFFFGKSINPLLITFSLTPIALFTIMDRLEEGRYNIFDFGLCVLLLPATGALAGHRAAFYTVIIIYALMVLFYLLNARKKAFLLSAALVIGMSLTVFSDNYTGCGFYNRVSNQKPLLDFYETFETIVEKFETSFLSLALSPVFADSALAMDVTKINDHEIVKATPDLESSSAWRILLWHRFFEFSGSEAFNWIIGEGRKAERAISPPFSHLHNQFFSYLVQGGLLKILASLLLVLPLFKQMLASPPVVAFLLMYAGQFMSNSPLWNSASLPQFLISVLFVTCALKVKNENSLNVL